MKDELHNKTRLSRYFLIVLMTIIIVTAMLYSFFSSSQMINKYSPLVDAAMEIKLEATTAHLWFEEIISGDRYKNLDDVIKHIDLALWYAQAMLEGGQNQEGTFIALADEVLKKEVAATIVQLKEFKQITFKRFQTIESSGIGTEIDQQYDQLFIDFITQTDNVETLLQTKIRESFKRYQLIQIALTLVTLILSLSFLLFQYRYDHRQTKNILNINKAKNRAEKKEQWLNTIMNSMGDGVITTDVNGNVTRINPVAEELIGWLQSEAKGQSLKTIFPIINATTRRPIENPVDKVISIGETVYLSNHTTLIAKDGSEHQIADSAAPIRDTDSNILGMVLVFNDVTEKYRIREQLRQSLQRLSLHWQDTPLGIIEWNEKFEFVDLNPAAEQIFGFTKAEVEGQHFTKNILPESARVAVEKVATELLSNTGGKHSLNENLTKDGRTIFCEWHNTPLVNEDGKVIGISSLVTDISAKRLAEERLRLSSRFFIDTNEGIMVTDAKATITDVNPAFCDITGYSRDEIIGKNPNFLNSGNQGSEFFKDMWQKLEEQGHWKGEIWNRKKDGTLYVELLHISSLMDEYNNIEQYVGLFSDITQSKNQQATLEKMDHYDVLTQLPNRMLLADRYILALAHSKREKKLLAICFLDLDNFKPVNDTYGHETGDQLLIEVAKRIKLNIRDEDTASRQGGDEFVLLLGNFDSFSQCEQLLKRILKTLAQPYMIEDQPLSISASIGVSLNPTDDADLDTLVRQADQAMYQAKLAGRNRYHLFNTEQDQLATQKHIRLKEIQQALTNSELCLYYQPKVDMKTGRVFGAEALIRWIHPEKGLIPPLDFLPVLEGTSLEILVGSWVINEAIKQLNLWKDQGIELEVSVNISSYHLQSPSFVAELEDALNKFPELDSQYLQLEILESSALGDLKSINSIIKTCIHTLGVKIALDDFGTGYSSLTHLRNLPAKTIKIDQSFVRDLLDDPDDYAIIDGIIGLAHSFNRNVIAEGVETTEHGLLLIIMGCCKAQGFSIARPMPSIDFQNWLVGYTPNQKWATCANKSLTQQEIALKLFKLTIDHWQEQLKNKIQSLPNNVQQWPILKRTHCHCGVWIQRARHDQLYDEKWLKKLDAAHNAIHDIASDLYEKYQKEEIKGAKDRLPDLEIAIEHMKKVWEQCV